MLVIDPASKRLQQGVERALAAGGRLQARVAQAAVPIELEGLEGVAALDQQPPRLLRFRRGGDRPLERVAVEAAPADGVDLRTDGEARIEGRRVPDDSGHDAVLG